MCMYELYTSAMHDLVLFILVFMHRGIVWCIGKMDFSFRITISMQG